MKHGWHFRLLLAVGVSGICLALSAWAQEAPPPAQQPDQPQTEKAPPEDMTADESASEPTEGTETDQAPRTPRQPSADEIIREFQRQRPTAVPILPSGDEDEINVRAAPGTAPGVKTRPRLPDGYMLLDRTGRIVQEGQWWAFIFESDSDAHPEPPMKLLPNRALERMVRESRGGLDTVVFIVSGEVTDFRGDNYLLPRKVLRKRDLGNLKK